jgi:hypothetical protein
MTTHFDRILLAFFVALLFLSTAIASPLSTRTPAQDHFSSPQTGLLDVNYVYNITKALSDIVFTDYGPGEIAKGREFGTKGEHHAADILRDNMTLLGLLATKDRLHDIAHLNIIGRNNITDYDCTLHHQGISESVDCYIASIFSDTFDYHGLQILQNHPTATTRDYVLIQRSSYHLTLGDSHFPSLKFKLGDFKAIIPMIIDKLRHPHWKGLLVYDTNSSTHDMPGIATIPIVFINGSVGVRVNASPSDYTIDFHLTQQKIKVESYNVIGELPGTDPTKTVIVDCLYDGWWNQATGDAAIGMGIVLGVAKYFHDHHITPQYTVKFIGFAGEEYGMRGAKYYIENHTHEHIVAVIDLNQLGFRQTEPRLTLQLAANSKKFSDHVWTIAQRTDYLNRTGNVTGIASVVMPFGHISDDHAFALARPSWIPGYGIDTVCFLKYGAWPMHHRDGENHTKGDVLSFFDPVDVSATGDMILNVTRSLAG